MIRFINSKLQRPHLSAKVIKRDRLIERLRSNLALSASLVCAGPGWGKTTVAAEFVDAVDLPSVWYDLDPSDADIVVFFQYLVRAVQQAVPEFGQSTLGLLSSGGSLRGDQLADLFLYELSEAVEHRLIVVLDNLHHVFEAAWSGPVLCRILQLLPENVHFILLARVAPGFTFSRMRSKQSMDQLDDRALAFSASEISDLFRNVLDDPSTIDKLLLWTQGWVAGLQIIRKALEADLSLRGHDIEQIITRSETEIFDYFAHRVYQAEPPAMRALLIRSALLRHVTCDVLNEALDLNITSDQLQAAVRQNVFLTRLSGENDTYTFHPLFGDFLRNKLREETTADKYREMHRRLGRYFAAQESWDLALHHFFEASDETNAARTLLSAEGSLLAAGLTTTVSSYLPGFRRDTLDHHPQLYNLMGEVRILEGDSAQADQMFKSALAAARPSNNRAVEAAALAGLAHTAVREHNFKEAIDYAEAARRCTSLSYRIPDRAALCARIKSVAGSVRIFEGRYTEANELMKEGLKLAHEAGDERLIRSISQNLALPAFMEGDFHAALRYFSRSPISEASGSRRPLHPDSILLYLNRAAIYTALGKLENAERDLANADELAAVFSLGGFVPRIIEARANLARERGSFEEADQLYEAALQEYQNVDSPAAKSDVYYERALLELRRGDLARALEVADELVADRQQNGREIELAIARQMRGRVLIERGDPRAIEEVNPGEPLLRRLQCNYYLAINCYVKARALFERDIDAGRNALVEFLRLAERFDYSYFVLSEELFRPVMRDLCRRYSVASEWLTLALASAVSQA